MAVTISIPISSLLFALLALLATTSIRAHDYNVLLSGETLGVDDPISNSGNKLVMESDCALVLCNNGRRHYLSDRTSSKVGNCTVTLNYHGQFVTHDGNGSTLWTSKLNSDTPLGRYAAVMRPDGQVWIYGPAVSGTPPYYRLIPPDRLRKEFPEINVHMMRTGSNVLFSGQILYDGQMLQTRGSQLAMRDDCSLTLSTGLLGVIWQSGTVGRGCHCFARLNHRGQLTVLDDRNNVLAVSGPESAEGDYVLVLQVNGQAVIYGPVVWSSFH